MTSSNINCEAFDAALPDYLEGTLDDSRRVAVEGHLRECVRCASLLRDLQNINKEASELPDLVPSRDLWAGIEARIAAPVISIAARPERARRVSPAWMGIAAAALVMTTAGVTYMLTARSLRPGSPQAVASANPQAAQTDSDGVAAVTSESGVAPGEAAAAPAGTRQVGGSQLATRGTPNRPATPPASATFAAADQASSDAVYGKEIEMLQKIVSQRRTQLDSSTVAIIERNLSIIDAAIEQSRAALARDPASRLLGDQLTRALDKKVELLRTAAMLPAST